MTPAGTISLKFWIWDYPHKNVWDGFLFLLATYNISEKKVETNSYGLQS